MDYLYHGSAVPGITALEARSTLHGTDKQIVYLTDSIPYALLYIWDGARSGSPVKHVTAWVEGGAARYEEQFPHQLERFYQGVSPTCTGNCSATRRRGGWTCCASSGKPRHGRRS